MLPFAEKEYGVSKEPSLRSFGGSSFGGICALCAALRHPGVFGSFLVESPSLWFGDERMLREELPGFQGPWPARVFLAMGTKVRGGGWDSWKAVPGWGGGMGGGGAFGDGGGPSRQGPACCMQMRKVCPHLFITAIDSSSD